MSEMRGRMTISRCLQFVNFETMLPEFSLLFVFFSLVASCPSKEALSPCTCESSNGKKYVRCPNLDNQFDLLTAASALKGVKDIVSLVIKDGVLNYIPHNLFEGVYLSKIYFRSTSLMALTDTDVAFVGLEDSLEELKFRKCNFMNSWDWSWLKNLKKLEKINIFGGDLEDIGEEMREINNLNMRDITFWKNKISHIYEHAFSNFAELQYITLAHNLIGEMKRSMLPNPAPKLKEIKLSYNEIQQFPADMFENMPSLEWLYVTGNKLLTLNEKTFSPVWEQLQYFSALDNKLRCDCRMSWITKLKMPPPMKTVCDQPQKLKGRNLATLISQDLWCFV